MNVLSGACFDIFTCTYIQNIGACSHIIAFTYMQDNTVSAEYLAYHLVQCNFCLSLLDSYLDKTDMYVS